MLEGICWRRERGYLRGFEVLENISIFIYYVIRDERSRLRAYEQNDERYHIYIIKAKLEKQEERISMEMDNWVGLD